MTRFKTAFIVRNEEDVSEALKSAAAPLFLCVDEAVFGHCRKNRYECFLLDEDLIREDFASVNRWGYEKAIEFAGRPRDEKERAFFEANFLQAHRLFIQVMKYCLVFDKIFKASAPEEITVFEPKPSLLAMTCEQYLKMKHPGAAFRSVAVKRVEKRRRPTLKQCAASVLTPWVNFTAGRSLQKSAGHKLVLASGAIIHLSPVLLELKRKHGCRIVYAEHGFNLEKYKYCRRNGMIYLLLPQSKHPRPCADAARGLDKIELTYKDADYTDVFKNVFAGYFGQGLVRYFYEEKALSDLFEKHRFEAVLLDEDVAMRRMIGVFANTEYFVVSHGIPAGLSEEPSAGHVYRSGNIFSSSEFERREYERLYYDMSRVFVTGVPRYDQLLALKRSAPASGPVKKILHCTAGFGPYTFESFYTLLGLKNFFGASSERYLLDLLRLLQERDDVWLKIKPHYDERLYLEKCMEKYSARKRNFEILRHDEDTFRLESEADLIVTVESSVVCEAIMLDKPVIVLDYTKNPLFSHYERYDLIECARNEEELRLDIQKCLYDQDYLRALALRRREHFHYFAGPFDGRNTERAADTIVRLAGGRGARHV